MNFNTNLWNTTDAIEFGDYEVLELGGHELVIIDAKEYTGETGNTSLKVEVDIAGNDKQKGFFKKQFDNNTNADKKWSNSAVRYLSLKDENLGYLKGFITALEKSNGSFKFNINGSWEQLKGLKIAGQFGLEEYQKEDGTTGFKTKLVQFRSMDKLTNITIPKVKLLNGCYIEYEEYLANKNSKNNSTVNPFSSDDEVVEITDDFLD